MVVEFAGGQQAFFDRAKFADVARPVASPPPTVIEPAEEVIDLYDQERRQGAAENRAPSDEEVDAQAKRAAGQTRAKRPVAATASLVDATGEEEIEIDDDGLPGDEDAPPAPASGPIYLGEQPDGIAGVGSRVRVLLKGGTETFGVIRGRTADGDLVVRRMNRQGTTEEDFRHADSDVLALSGKPVRIEPNLPLPVEDAPANAVKKVQVGDAVMVPGTAGGEVLVDVLTVDEKAGNATVRVRLSGVERVALIAKMAKPTDKEISRVAKLLAERQGIVRRQGVEPGETDALPLPEQALMAWVGKLTAAFPRVRVTLLPDAEMVGRFGEGTRGAVERGMIYLNRDAARLDTPLHEFAHIYTSVLKRYHSQLYSRGLDLVRGTDYEARVRAAYPNLTSEGAILEEALVTAIGNKGVTMPTPSTGRAFLTWAKLILRRISEGLGLPLSMETTLDAFVTARARELQSGRSLSNEAPESLAGEDVQLARAPKATPASPPITLPALLDEATLASGQLDEAARQALQRHDARYTPSTGEYARTVVDVSAQAAAITANQDAVDKMGKVVGFVRDHVNILTPDNLLKLTFGEKSPFYQQHRDLQEQQQRMVAGVNIASQDFAAKTFDTLKGRTTYRGATSWDAVEKWDVTGMVAGQSTTLQLPVDVVMDIAGQYRTALAQYGHIDPKWEEKRTAGREEVGVFEVPNPNNPRSPRTIELTKTELRALETRVFYQDGGTQSVMADWEAHAQSQRPIIARIYSLVNGKPMGAVNWYYPLSLAGSEGELNRRTIQQFVDDAGLLKNRQGIPEKLRADGLLQSTARYAHQSANFVQLSPLWHNLDRILVNHRALMDSDERLHRLRNALARLRDNYASPDAGRSQAILGTSDGGWDVGRLLRLATLSRFAFNLAIPLKQITGYTSALGNGLIRDEFLLQRDGQALRYLGLIAESYWLTGRGSREGNYSGGDTSFDQTLTELRGLAHPDAGVLVWRMQGAAHPDVVFDDWSGASTKSKMHLLAERVRHFMEDYGLSMSRRADAAVVRSLYEAAKAQVRHDNPGLTAAEIAEAAVPLAKGAMYYSNQTFDKTDRAPLQLDGNFVTRLVTLYKGQNFKTYNTMAARALELGAADPKDRPEARKRLRKAIAINAVLAPLMTAGIDALIAGLRSLSGPSDEKKEEKEEQTPVAMKAAQVSATVAAQMMQVVPGSPKFDFLAWMSYRFANPNTQRKPFDSNPLSGAGDFVVAVSGLLTSLETEYRSDEAMVAAQINVAQQIFRSGATIAGVSQEAVRLLNHQIERIKPEADNHPTRHRRERSDERERNYGIEYWTGTAEDAPGRRRR